MSKNTMNYEEIEAVKELIEKIPPEDLEKAVGGMDEDTREVLKKFFRYVGIAAAALGTGMLIDKYWPRGAVNGYAQNLELRESDATAETVYRYRTDNGIKKAYRDRRIKNKTELCKAYKCLHPDFKGTRDDVLTILGL